MVHERAWFAKRAGPPYVPVALRVSKTRHGASVWNADSSLVPVT